MIVYKMMCKPTGRCYIGCTKRTLEERMQAHRNAKNNKRMFISRAIKKYGFENFDVDILWEGDSFEEMLQQEIKFIAQFNTRTPRGYNITAGGEGTLNTKKSVATRKKQSERIRATIKANPEKWAGHPHTEESRRKISEAHKKRMEDPEYRKAMVIRITNGAKNCKPRKPPKSFWENGTAAVRKVHPDQWLAIYSRISSGEKTKDICAEYNTTHGNLGKVYRKAAYCLGVINGFI